MLISQLVSCCSITLTRISKVGIALSLRPEFMRECALSVKPGDRIAQLILERIAIADVAEVDDLDET